jgi:hypothetical protein
MRIHVAAVCVFALLNQLPGAAMPQEPTSGPTAVADADRLPVKRVVLYKNGVGFFEHLGRVHGNQQVTIDFTSGQLNDVLKSLTTVDLDNGRVTGVSFNTDDPANRRLGALSLPLDEETSVLAFLGAIRGARVEVQSGGAAIVGRVLAVENRTRDENGKAVEARELALITDAGELRTVDVSSRMSVRVLENDLRGDVRRYLDIVSSSRQRDLRRMTIATTGTGDRRLYVSYISEVPLWKSTYRLVLPKKTGDKPLLQGWAIVDNTIGEDWTDVELSLVAGSPQSFIQQLSQPLYARRPVIPLPSAVQLSPQTHEAMLTTGAEAETTVEDRSMAPKRAMAYAPAPEAGLAGGVAVGLPNAPPAPAPRDVAFEALAKVESAATGQELGDLFEYRLREPVTIRKNQSAMVPIISTTLDVERVSVWNASTGGRPRTALWMTNSTPLTLDSGTFSVLEDATFTGEGLMETIKPGERRLLSYAADLSLLVDVKRDSAQPERVTGVRIAKGMLILQRELRDSRTYTVRNADPKARTLVIEHPNRAGWKLLSATRPEETTPNTYRFKMVVAPKSTATLSVEEQRDVETTYLVSNVTDDQLGLLVQQRSLSPEAEQALRAVLAKKNEIVAVGREIDVRTREDQRIASDQERVRENMKALGGRTEEKNLVSRYARQLDEQETRLEVIRREVAEREATRQRLQHELDLLIQNLSFGGR